jgi:hypothetical protein
MARWTTWTGPSRSETSGATARPPGCTRKAALAVDNHCGLVGHLYRSAKTFERQNAPLAALVLASRNVNR